MPVKAGLHTVAVTSPRENLKAERDAPAGGQPGAGGGRGGTTQLPWAVDVRLDGARVKRFDVVAATAPETSKLVVGGPYAPTGRGDSLSRRKIFVCRAAQPAQEPSCARTIIGALAHRAFRRPVTKTDVEPVYAFYEQGRVGGDFDSGIQAAIEAMLVAPEFLFRIEQDPVSAKPGEPHRITDVELASRLSFFLWSSIPDEELLTLAERGGLS